MTPFLEELAARRRFGMKPGLETIRALCAVLGDPQRKCQAIHVAGTNGKGAVCAVLDAALRSVRLRIGRYTSPHLVKINERFFLDGAPIDDKVLERVAKHVNSSIQTFGHSDVTFFEALTAVAFELYAERKVDYAILECGLGGRLDATNIARPALSVITRIGLDHCDWLGDTVEKIAAEKAGILKRGVPIVLGCNESGVRSVIESRAKEVGAPFHYAPDLVNDDEIPADFSLAGAFNRENAMTALAALRVLFNNDSVRLSASLDGFSRVVWPGRFQRVGGVLVDGAHNPPAAEALARALEEDGVAPKSLDLVCGFCGDKDVSSVLAILAPFARRGFAVKTNNPRSLSAAETASEMSSVGIPATPCASLASALSAADPSATLVCGSLFLAGEALVVLRTLATDRFDPSETIVPG